MSKKESIGIITILAVLIMSLLSLWCIRTLNKSDAGLVLYLLKNSNVPNEYVTEIKEWEKSSTIDSTKHYVLYELHRNQKHLKYVVVRSDDSSNTKDAFVVYNIDNIADTSKRGPRGSTLAPEVHL